MKHVNQLTLHLQDFYTFFMISAACFKDFKFFFRTANKNWTSTLFLELTIWIAWMLIRSFVIVCKLKKDLQNIWIFINYYFEKSYFRGLYSICQYCSIFKKRKMTQFTNEGWIDTDNKKTREIKKGILTE